MQTSELIAFKELYHLPELSCPLEKKPYTNAQMVDCKSKHTFSLNSILKLCGEMVDGACRPEPCPLCHTKITAYWPNLQLQALVNSILKFQLPNLSDCKNEDLSFKPTSLILKEKYHGFYSPFYSLMLISESFNLDQGKLLTIDLTIDRQKKRIGPKYQIIINLKDKESANQLTRILQKKDIKVNNLYKSIIFRTDENEPFLKLIQFCRETNVFKEDLKSELDDFCKEIEIGNPHLSLYQL